MRTTTCTRQSSKPDLKSVSFSLAEVYCAPLPPADRPKAIRAAKAIGQLDIASIEKYGQQELDACVKLSEEVGALTKSFDAEPLRRVVERAIEEMRSLKLGERENGPKEAARLTRDYSKICERLKVIDIERRKEAEKISRLGVAFDEMLERCELSLRDVGVCLTALELAAQRILDHRTASGGEMSKVDCKKFEALFLRQWQLRREGGSSGFHEALKNLKDMRAACELFAVSALLQSEFTRITWYETVGILVAANQRRSA